MRVFRLKLGQAQAAQQLCTTAIARDSQNVKALYRRALASISLHEYGAAKADLLSAVKLEPGNKAVRMKLKECGEAASREKASERRLYAAMFGSAGGVPAQKSDGAHEAGMPKADADVAAEGGDADVAEQSGAC